MYYSKEYKGDDQESEYFKYPSKTPEDRKKEESLETKKASKTSEILEGLELVEFLDKVEKFL